MKIVISVCREIKERYDAHDVLHSKEFLEDTFSKKGLASEALYLEASDFDNAEALKQRIVNSNPSCVFNLFEGLINDSYKEAEFVSILESLNIPYTGNPSRTLSLCLNKEMSKKVLREHHIPVPKGTVITHISDLNPDHVTFPSFIKPCCEDASLGIDEDSLVTTREALYSVLEKKLKEHSKGIIVETFIPGNEYNVGFLGEYPFEPLGVSVLNYSYHKTLLPFLSYNAKWKAETEEYKVLTPSPDEAIDEQLKRKIITTAREAGKALGCRNYFRVDMREKDGELFVLDVNPNPDINRDSGFMRQAYAKGYTYEDVIEKILKSAITPAN